MGTYKGIKGVKVESKASDPSASEAAGQVWYNTSSKALKYAVAGAGSWASGGALNAGRGQMGLTGIITAAVAFGGIPGNKTNTETYNGTAWTAKNALNTGVQYNFGFGTQTAAVNAGGVVSGGADTDITETWDGTNWTTSPADLNTARQKASAANQGTTTAGLIFGGYKQSPNTSIANVESWNGSAWTETADVNTAREQAGGGGTSTAAFFANGYVYNSPYPANTEIWNGTSWTEVNNCNTGRQAVGSSGTTTSALIYGGTYPGGPGPTKLTEQWDGTSWTEVADLATAAEGKGKGCGVSGDSALAAGFDGSPNTITEEWTNPVYAVKSVTVS